MSRHRKSDLTKTVYIAASSRRHASTPRGIDRVVSNTSSSRINGDLEHQTLPDDWAEQSRELVHAGTVSTARYLRDLLATSLKLLLGVVHILQTPLAIILTLYIIFLVLSRVATTMLLPMCSVPGMSLFPLCAMQARPVPAQDPKDRPPRWADYPRLVDMQASTFEQLLDHTAGGSSLALEIKKAEMATKDLATLVRASDLTSRELLADTLEEFVNDAKKTGEDLQRLGAKVGGAVDSVMAVNDYALHQISAHVHEPSALVRMLWPWSGAPQTREVVRATFESAMTVMGDAMARIVVEAQVSLGHLQDLEERLGTLYEIVTREDRAVQDGQDELLAALWTRFGGNDKKVKNFERHVQLLRGVHVYRKQALAHVVGTLQTLRGMQADTEELRARVSGVPIGGDRIPVEVHMRSIQTGLERMKEGRMRAKQFEKAAMRKVLSDAD